MTDAPTTQQAIAASLAGDWNESIRINTILSKQEPKNVDIFNRLGFAYCMLGQIHKAKRAFHKVFAIDKYNQIALKNIKKLEVLKKKYLPKASKRNIAPLLFLEEPGKTKIAACINLARTDVLSALSPGQEVVLKAKNHRVEIRDDKHVYLAALPDDIAFKLIKLLKGGNTYQAVIKGVEQNSLLIMLRELSRGKRYATQPSFIPQTAYMPFSRIDSLSPDKPNVASTGEDDEEDADIPSELPVHGKME